MQLNLKEKGGGIMFKSLKNKAGEAVIICCLILGTGVWVIAKCVSLSMQ